MNKCLFSLFTFIALAPALVAFGENSSANAWGPITNGIQMSIGLENGLMAITNGEPCKLLIRFKNLSVSESVDIIRMLSDRVDATYSFQIIDPLGQDISPTPNRVVGGSANTIEIAPNQTRSVEFNLSDVCTINKPGEYKVIAKKAIWLGDEKTWIQAVSNPLLVTVLHSE